MPFTVSHAVVAVPFSRLRLPDGRGVPVAAVAAGAMAPDLPLFFPRLVSYQVTHAFPGLLVVSVPIALVLYGVWRLVLRPAASGLLPRRLGSRVPPGHDQMITERPPHRVGPIMITALLILAAATLGVGSHVLWDQFTHAGRLGEQWIPALGAMWGPLPVTKWLQYGSGVGGMLGLLAWAVSAARSHPVTPRHDGRAVGLIRVGLLVAAAAAVLITVVAYGLDVGWPTTSAALYPMTFAVVTRGGAAVVVLILLAATAVRLVRTASSGRRPVAGGPTTS